ncbi:MAG: hypothetical protein PHQ58_01740 [Rhodoferax sp.]|uniref:hypothetical protein n=1 Tax=Rhodoferax sp. TaxID=50421 RepID=UPI00261B724B|nr:hypothetical protein [Rhodoferax sp.]MDD2879133.1 hypothetical protein [Rhodoferax sp.]
MKLLALALVTSMLFACGGSGADYYYGAWQTSNAQNEKIELQRFPETFATESECQASSNAQIPTPDFRTDYECVHFVSGR